MWTFAWCLTERYERLTTDRPFDVSLESIEHWDAVAWSELGFVMVTAHLGMYEVSSMLPTPNGPRHVHLVREPEVEPRAQEFIRECVRSVEGRTSRCTSRATTRSRDGFPRRAAPRRNRRRAGGPPARGSRTVEATLFGRPIPLPSGPAALARTAGVPMLPVFAIRTGRRRCRVVFGPPITVPRTHDRNADLTEAVGRVAVEVERAVRGAPYQWFVFRELWPKRPRVSRRGTSRSCLEAEPAFDGDVHRVGR